VSARKPYQGWPAATGYRWSSRGDRKIPSTSSTKAAGLATFLCHGSEFFPSVRCYFYRFLDPTFDRGIYEFSFSGVRYFSAQVCVREARELFMSQLITRFWKDQSGATAIEYGLIAAGISVVIIAVVNGIGTKLNTTFGSVSTQLK
jgi:pilus assembly protein Flp/PilA